MNHRGDFLLQAEMAPHIAIATAISLPTTMRGVVHEIDAVGLGLQTTAQHQHDHDQGNDNVPVLPRTLVTRRLADRSPTTLLKSNL